MSFRLLLQGLNNLQEQIVTLSSSVDNNDPHLIFLQRKLSFYKEVVSYISTASWLTKPKAKSNMINFIESGCDNKKALEDLGIYRDKNESNRFRSSISTSTKTFKEKFGESFIKSLINAMDSTALSDVIYTFSVASGSFAVKSLFLDEISSLLPSSEKTDASLAKAEREFRALRQFTKWYFGEKVSPTLNKDAIAKILFLLEDNNPKNALERSMVFNYLTGKSDDLASMLSALETIESNRH